MTNTIVLWILFAVFMVLDLIFVTVKASLYHARLPHLLSLREHREESVDKTIKLIETPQLRTSLRVAVMFAHFVLAGLITLLLMRLKPDLNFWLILLYVLIGMIVLSLIESALEAFVLKDPEEYAIKLRPMGGIINFFFMPLASLSMSLLGPNANQATMASMTEEDLKNWVEVGQPEGSLEKGEREMIYSIFQFGDTLAKEIMVPRIDVLALDCNQTLGDARETFVHAGHSRLPVYQDASEATSSSLLYAKDLLNIQQDDDLISDHRELLRLAYFVPEAKKVDELLAEMQTRSMHMAIVVDEYGGVAGVVTLEDIVEEIIGEIRDEYDESEELPYISVDEKEYIFQGRVDLGIFNEVMGTNIATENADTIGGYIYGQIGDVPTGGETIEADGVSLKVEQVLGRRIVKVRAKHIEEAIIEKDQKNVDE